MFKKILTILTFSLLLLITGCNTIENGNKSYYNDYKNSDKYEVLSTNVEINEVNKIYVNWIYGKVVLKANEKENVQLEEETNLEIEDMYKAHYYFDNGTLYIHFMAPKALYSPIDYKKELTILVGKKIDNIEIHAISNSVEISDLESNKIELNNISGKVILNNVSASSIDLNVVSSKISIDKLKSDQLDIKSVSGNISLINIEVINEIVINTVSGIVDLNVNINPKTIDIETTSGNIDLNLRHIENYHLVIKTIKQKEDIIKGSQDIEIVLKSVSGKVNHNLK